MVTLVGFHYSHQHTFHKISTSNESSFVHFKTYGRTAQHSTARHRTVQYSTVHYTNSLIQSLKNKRSHHVYQSTHLGEARARVGNLMPAAANQHGEGRRRLWGKLGATSLAGYRKRCLNGRQTLKRLAPCQYLPKDDPWRNRTGTHIFVMDVISVSLVYNTAKMMVVLVSEHFSNSVLEQLAHTFLSERNEALCVG